MTMVFGQTPTGLMVPVAAEEMGALRTSSNGWINSAVHRDPLRFGFSSFLHGVIGSSDLAAGTNNIDSSAVPSGRIWVLTNLAMAYAGTVGNVSLFASILYSAFGYVLYEQVPPVSGVYYDRQGWWVLAPGDKLRLVVNGATLHDSAFLQYNGFYVDTNL